MKLRLSFLVLIFSFEFWACTATFQKQIPKNCTVAGIIGADRVSHPTQGFDISFQYYLPPCYANIKNASFPVIYLLTMPFEAELVTGDNTPMSLADRLIREERMPPVIIIIPHDTVAQGYHAALATDLIPYVDQEFRTLRDRRFRSVGGISHGAAIAARMAFQFPESFGSLGILSGGIDPSEKATFTKWIVSTPAEGRPRVLISIGNQDGIRSLTENLLDVLASQNVSYELNVQPGGHDWAFWSMHMEEYLLWFADAWE